MTDRRRPLPPAMAMLSDAWDGHTAGETVIGQPPSAPSSPVRWRPPPPDWEQEAAEALERQRQLAAAAEHADETTDAEPSGLWRPADGA